MLSPHPPPDTLSVPDETLKRKTEKVKGTPETGHETQYQGNGISSLSRKGWFPGGTRPLVQQVWGADIGPSMSVLIRDFTAGSGWQ